MKKFLLPLTLIAFISCNKSNNSSATKSMISWADNIQTTLPLVRDTVWDENDWNKTFTYHKKEIFESITKGVLNGKLKAFSNYPDGEMTIENFKNLISSWDSTAVKEDPNNAGTMITAPYKMELTADDLVQIRISEKMEMDTLSYTLIQKVSHLSFIGYAIINGEMMGLKKLFDVKMNDNAEK